MCEPRQGGKRYRHYRQGPRRDGFQRATRRVTIQITTQNRMRFGTQARKWLKNLVGPCGLEPQTSTVSIWWPRDYGPLPPATKLIPLIEIASFRTTGNTPAQQVNFGDQCHPVLNSVLKSSKTKTAATYRSCKTGAEGVGVSFMPSKIVLCEARS